MRVLQGISLSLLLIVMNCAPTQKVDTTENTVWTFISSKEIEEDDSFPTEYMMLKLDNTLLEEKLNQSETPLISVPTHNGDFINVRLEDSGTMSPALAAKFPNIKSFQGTEIGNNSTTIRVDKNTSGLFAMITRDGEVYFINPIEKGSTTYIVYEKKYAKRGNNPFADKVIK